jgi:hypothetical protein
LISSSPYNTTLIIKINAEFDVFIYHPIPSMPMSTYYVAYKHKTSTSDAINDDTYAHLSPLSGSQASGRELLYIRHNVAGRKEDWQSLASALLFLRGKKQTSTACVRIASHLTYINICTNQSSHSN